MMHLLFLTALQSSVSLSLPNVDLTTILTRLLAIIPLVGGYLLVRESKGNVAGEIVGVLLLVLATVVPPTVTTDQLQTVFDNFLGRTPWALLLLGLAFVRDGGFKMVGGLAMIIAGLVLLPGLQA